MSITLDGIVFDEADFAGGGYLDLVAVGGVPYPRWQAFLLAALRDAARILVATSTTSVAIGTGSRVFVLADDIPLQPGANVKIVDIAAPNANWMFGEVTAYVSATRTLTVNVTKTAGGGTLANWRVQVAGLQGEAGAPGSAPYGATLPSALGTAATGSNADAARIDHVHPAADLGTGHVTGTLPLARGGTGAATAAAARGNLGASAVGDAVFTAADAGAARVAMGAAGTTDVQIFNSSGTWTKPAGCILVLVEAWGGGGGGGGVGTVTSSRSGGGGGGAYVSRLFQASSLAASLAVTIGAGGASGSNTGGNGGNGGNTTFGSHFTAYGGGGGRGNNSGAAMNGGGGGGAISAGTNGSLGGAGGRPHGTGSLNTGYQAGQGGFGGGFGATAVEPGGDSGYGGGGGGGWTLDAGSAVYGGAGGAGAGSGSAAGASIFGGAGGGGGTDADGAAGSSPGGGGGGTVNTATTGRAGGAGGAGRVVVHAW